MGKKGVSFLSLSAPFLSGGLPNSLHPVQVSSAASSGPHIVFPIICASAHQTTYVRTHTHTHTHTYQNIGSVSRGQAHWGLWAVEGEEKTLNNRGWTSRHWCETSAPGRTEADTLPFPLGV